MPEIYLKELGFICDACNPLNKNKERIRKIKVIGDIQDIFIKANQIKVVFNMIWLLEILKILIEE